MSCPGCRDLERRNASLRSLVSWTRKSREMWKARATSESQERVARLEAKVKRLRGQAAYWKAQAEQQRRAA